MTESNISPLRQRMLDDMALRRLHSATGWSMPKAPSSTPKPCWPIYPDIPIASPSPTIA